MGYLKHRGMMALLTASACLLAGFAKKANAETPVISGEDIKMAVLPGQGFNQVSRGVAGHCVELGPFLPQSDNATGQGAVHEILELSNITSLNKALRLDAAAYFDTIIGKDPSGRLGYLHTVSLNTQYRYLLIRTRINNQIENATSYRYMPEIQDFLRTNNDPMAFTTHCGNAFVTGRRTGVEVLTVIEFKIVTNADLTKFNAKVDNLQYQNVYGSGELQATMDNFQGAWATRVEIYRRGGRGALPRINSLSEFIRSVPTIVELSSDDPVTLELPTKDYGGVLPLDLMPNESFINEKILIVDNLARWHAEATQLLNDIEVIRANLKDYNYDPKVHDLNAMSNEVRNYLRVVEGAGRACLAKAWPRCVEPSVQMPEFSLPSRKK